MSIEMEYKKSVVLYPEQEFMKTENLIYLRFVI